MAPETTATLAAGGHSGHNAPETRALGRPVSVALLWRQLALPHEETLPTRKEARMDSLNLRRTYRL